MQEQRNSKGFGGPEGTGLSQQAAPHGWALAALDSKLQVKSGAAAYLADGAVRLRGTRRCRAPSQGPRRRPRAGRPSAVAPVHGPPGALFAERPSESVV